MLPYLKGYASLHEGQEHKLKRQNAGKEHSSSQMGLEGDRRGGKDRGRGRRKREEEIERVRRRKREEKERKREDEERKRGKEEEEKVVMLSGGMDQYCPSFTMYNESSENK